MVSPQRGMANEIVKMADDAFRMNRMIGVDVHCLWCIDHKLNLVARNFKDVPNINFVITFIDWITARDRLVSYTAFVRANPDFPKKKNPTAIGNEMALLQGCAHGSARPNRRGRCVSEHEPEPSEMGSAHCNVQAPPWTNQGCVHYL